MQARQVVHIDATMAHRLAWDLNKLAVTINPLIRARMKGYAAILERRILHHAVFGKPGIKARSGEYFDSIVVDMRGSNAFVSQIRAGSDHPASRRLEYGFIGHDSLGRFYDQAPRPHFRPAANEVFGMMNLELPAFIDSQLDG